jgi:Ethanolamine utilisation protein EutQ
MAQRPTSEVTQFRIRDLDLTPTADDPTLPPVNVGYSHDLGAGMGAFENCAVPWTVTYDEVLFIKEGVPAGEAATGLGGFPLDQNTRL